MPPELTHLRGTIRRALEAAGGAFAPLVLAFGWVHRVAHVLGQDGGGGAAVRSQLSGLLGAMRRHRESVGELGGAVDHFLKVTRSYWPGLFHCYDTPNLPRTNNDLEQAFGSHRYHERRATGRKGASPALVLRGSARLVAGLGTRAGAGTAADLAGANREEWKRMTAWLSAAVRLPTRRRKCTPGVVWQVLLWAAAFTRSVAAACDAVPAAPSGQAVWDALRAALPKRRRTLERRLLPALHAPLRRRPGAARVAIDYHLIPYYGEPDRHTTRAKSSAGTHNFHTYATACVVGDAARYTVGLTAVGEREPMTDVLTRLLDQVAAARVPIRAVLLDRAFFTIAVLQLLQARRLPFVVPVVVRGRRPRPGVSATGLRAFRRRAAGRYAYTHADRGRSVQADVVVAHKSYRHCRTGRRRSRIAPVHGLAGERRAGGGPGPVPDPVRGREQLPPTGRGPAPDIVPGRGHPAPVGRHRAGDPERLGVGEQVGRPAVDAGGRPARVVARHPDDVQPSSNRKGEPSPITAPPNLKVLDSV